VVFNQITLDGYFTGANGDLSWAYTQEPDPEWQAFVAENASGESLILLGRITYELMASYWPTPQASENDPIVAQNINRLPKVVFSRTLDNPSWNNTRVVRDDIEAEVRRLKAGPGPDMVILGSGSIVSQLAGAGLIDEYQIVVKPVVLGAGKTLFEGVKDKLDLTLTKSRIFGNGNALLCYEPKGP
jgi:dihydrofolate reductase